MLTARLAKFGTSIALSVATGYVSGESVTGAPAADGLVCAGPYGQTNELPPGGESTWIKKGQEKVICDTKDALKHVGHSVTSVICQASIVIHEYTTFRCQNDSDCARGVHIKHPYLDAQQQNSPVCLAVSNGTGVDAHVGVYVRYEK